MIEYAIINDDGTVARQAHGPPGHIKHQNLDDGQHVAAPGGVPGNVPDDMDIREEPIPDPEPTDTYGTEEWAADRQEGAFESTNDALDRLADALGEG